MQYNKNEFNKVNDKKIMKKVKKQWVVVSVATLAFLGASAYGMMTTSVLASANTNGTQDRQQQSVNNKKSNQSGDTTTSTATATQSNTQSVQPTQPAINTTYAGSVTSYNNNDDSVTYANQIKQGYTDAYNNKSNQSSNISGNGANYYNAAYDGAKTAMSAYNSATQNLGAGTQDYNYYGNTVKRADGYKDDNANAQTGTQGSNNQSGSQSSNQNGNPTNSQNSSTNSTNSTDGTPLNPNSYNDPNQGGADNPKDASTSVSKYETTMDSKLNNAQNVSVKVTSANQQITIPTANTVSIVNEKNKFNNAQGLLNAYSQAVTYVLTQQGLADAESGKWQGVYVGSNNSTGTTKDYYLTSNNSDSSNVYDQAYRGARDAMNAYFSSSNAFNGVNNVNAISQGNSAYQQGYNDVVNQANNGIIYVQNGQQYSSVMTGQTGNGNAGGNIATLTNGTSINTIRLANDIDLSGATNGENDGTVNTNSPTFTLDGQNHLMDFHGNNYTINSSSNLNVYIQNFQTMYGSNFYGTFRAVSGAPIHFSNLNYVGPELLSSYSNDAYFTGNVNVIVPIHGITYTSPFQSNVTIEGNGNQENLEVGNFILEPDSHYFGNTSPALGGTNVVVQGNFTLGENSKMTLIARGGNSNAATIVDGSTWGVYLNKSSASLNINKNATLNIIPQTYNAQSNIFSGAVYAGVQVSININGGTLNYEGYGGTSGYYNQPIDLQGSNQTQINVINGGVLQVLMDSVPDITTYYNYNGHQSAYNGLINNVGLGSFNIGARGNLKVGITNSNSGYNVPYYGPININSVGSNHVIFEKSTAVQQFQTTTGQSGTGVAGNINAYTVGVKDAKGNMTYLYNFILNSGSNTYTGTDFNGNQVSGNISGNNLDISDIPAVQFVGPLTKTKNNDGSYTVNAYAKISNYSQFTKAFPTTKPTIYVGVATSPSNGSYNQMTQITGQNLTDGFSKADPNQYTTSVDASNYDGGIIPITYNIPSGTDTTNVGMRLQFFINSVNTTLGPNAYTSTVEGYTAGSNGKVVENSSGDMQIANGQLGNISSGTNDALADMVNGNSAAKSAESFTIQTNADYAAAYNSVQAGYQAFLSNPNTDYTKLSAYINASNPTAFIQGYKQAAYQAGQRDAQFNKNNVSNINYLGAKALYTEAQTQYNQAYTDALQNIGVGASQIIARYQLPTINSNGTTATAVTQAISDAYGVAQFIQDEQSGNISTTTAPTVNYNSLSTSQQISYADAYTGYKNALNVAYTDNNTDSNADKAESAGFDYAQSIINGGLSTSNPQSTSSHMNQLTYAQSGYSIAQAAVQKAKANGKDNSDAQNINFNNPGSVSSDSSSDVTAYQYIKIGAYTALKNQSDNGLNTMEKVGYSLVASAQAYANGMNAFDLDNDKNSDTIPTATDPISTSTVGQPQYNQGYINAKTAYNQGIADAVANARAAGSNVGHLSETPASIPANVATGAQTEYKNAYKAAIDGYQDGNYGAQNDDKGNHYNNTNSDPNYDKSYNSAYNTARADAGANDYLTKHSEAASDKPYVAGYSDASAGHSSGYSAASSAASTSTSVPAANQVNPSANAQYTAGFNGGVSDEQNAANALAGANDYLANQTMPSGSAFQAGFSAAESGFKAAQAKSSSASSNTNYSLGYAAYSSVASAWSQDETQSGFASASGSANPTTVTNDVFNATVSSLGGKNYTNSQSSQGNLYQDISQTLGSQAATNYSNGVSSAVSSSGASSNDYFTSLGIKDVNDGYNNASNANTQSIGFQEGQLLKQNESNGAQMALNDATQDEPSDQQQKDAFDATKAAYQAVAASGSQAAVKDSNLSTHSRSYQDAYNKAFDDANAQKDANQQTAINAAKTGSGDPFSGNGASDQAWSAVYGSIKSGYTDGQSAKPNNSNNNPNYDLGYTNANKFNSDVSQAESNDNPDVIANTNNDDAFKGAAQALKDVYDNGPQSHINQDSTHSSDYVKAYNQEVDKANAANKQSRDDMTNGVSKNDSNVANNNSNLQNASNTATKAIYDHAYDQVATGFDAGLNSSSGSGYPSNSDQQVGYNNATGVDATNGYQAGKDLSKGYQAAVSDFLAGKTNPSDNSAAGYADTMNALIAAKNGSSMPAASTNGSSALVKYAYSQEKATMDAIAAAQTNSNAASQPSTIPAGVDSTIYNKAYSAAIDGFKDGHQTPAVSTNKKSNNTSSIYTASYAQGLKGGRIQQGAEDYVKGQIDSNTQNNDPSYAEGVKAAQNGFADGKAGTDKSSEQPIDDQTAYSLGQTAGQNSQNGIAQANETGDPSSLQGDAKNAYYGVKDAYASLENGTTKPSDNHGVQTGSHAYTSAYNDALSKAKSDAKTGVSKFAAQTAPTSEIGSDGKYNPTSDNDDTATAYGYNQALAGYNAAVQNKQDQNNSDPSYQAGVSLANDLAAGISAAKNNGTTTDDAQRVAYDAVKQAYVDAKKGASFTSVPQQDSAYAKVYQDAYNKVQQDASADVSNGVQNYLNGGSKSGKSDIDSQESDAAFDSAKQGFFDGSGSNATNNNSSDKAYTEGFNAAKSVQQAIADKQNNADNSKDSTKNPDNDAYNKATTGYVDGLDSITSSKSPAQSNVEYTTAFKQAVADGSKAYSDGVQNALNSLSSAESDTSSIDSHDVNSPLGKVAKQGFDDFKDGFDNEIQNASNNTHTTISNPNSANNQGAQFAQTVETDINTAINQSNNNDAPTVTVTNNSGITNDINTALLKAFNAYKNATDQSAAINTPSDFTATQKYAFTQEIAHLQQADIANLAQAKQKVINNSIPSDSQTDDVANKTRAIVNGISDANSSNPAHTSDESTSAKTAYDLGKQMGNQAQQNGAQAYLSGETEPVVNNNSPLDEAKKTGYDDAGKGFMDGLKSSTQSQPNNPNYISGYNAAQALKAVEANIQGANSNQTYTDTASGQQAQAGYQAAVQVFKASSDPDELSNTAPSGNSVVYKQAYSDAIDKLRSDYDAGRKQFTQNGKTSADTSSVNNSDEKTAIQQGLADENTGFTAGLTGQTISAPNTAQSEGQTLGSAVKREISADMTNGHTVNTGNDDLNAAINAAKQAVINSPINASDTITDDSKSDLYKQVYQNAVDQFKAAYQTGVNSVVTGSENNPTSVSDSNDLFKQGANDAKDSIDAGFSGSQNHHPELSNSYKLGEDAKNGYLNGTGQSNILTNSDAATTGKNAAQQAITDATNTSVTSTSLDDKSEVYKLAYNAVRDNNVVQTAKDTGATAFTSGQIEPSGNDQLSKLNKDSYDDALAGYNAAKNNNEDQNKANDSAYKAGVTAYNDAQKGIQLANQHLQTDSVPTTDPNNNNDTLSDSEKLAYQAVMDAYKGNNESNPGNPIYDDAYKQALSDKFNAAKQGSLNALNASDSQYTPNTLQHSAYTQGQTDANSGYSAAKSDVTGTVDPNNVNTGINQIDAQNGAKLAFQDALNGKTDSNGAPSNASDVFKAAYSKAMREANGYISTGIADAKKNSNPSLTGNDAESKLTQAAYENFMNGYNTEKSNKESNSSLDTQSTVPGFKDGVSAADAMETAVSNYELTGKTNGSDQNGNYQQIADDAYNDGVNGNTSHEGTDVPSGDEDALAKNDVYSKIQQQAANNAVIGANTFLAGGNKDTNTTAIADKAQGSGFDNASSGFADGNKVSATPSQPNNPSYMTGYNAGQAVYQVEQNFESGANNSPSDTTSAQQANSAYNQAISDFNTNHAASDTTANGNNVYQTVYKHAMDHLQAQYNNGINDFNAGQSSPDMTSIKQSPSSQAARATGFNDANTEFTKVLTHGDGVKTQNPNLAKSAGAQLADKVLGRINEINVNNQSPQSTGDTKLDNAIDAAKDAVLTNPNATDTSYPAGVTGNNIYQQAYKQAVDLFEAQYAKGVKSTIDPTENSASVNLFTQKGQNDAENAITAGFNNSDNTNYQTPQVLSDAYTSGQQAKIGMTNGENGQNDQSSSNASYSDKQGNQAALDAIESRQSGQTDDNPSSISSKPKSYQLAYKQAIDDANASAIQGAQSLFANNNQDPTKGAQGGSYQIANPTNSTDKAKNRGLLEASQALTDAQSNSSDKDGQYDPTTVAGKVYFATKMAYNNIDPSGVSDYNNKVDVNNDPVAKAAYDAALSNAQSIAKKAAQDYVDGQDNSSDYNGNSIAEKLYKDAHDVNEIAFNNGLNNDNPSGKYTNKYDDPSLTYLAVKNAIADYVNNNNQASAKANNIGIVDSHGVYDKAYKNALAKIQDAVNAGVSEYEAGKTLADISAYGAPNESALGVVAKTAAERAKAGHDDALAGTTAPTNVSITNDSSYLAGKQYGQQIDAGYNIAVSQGAGAPKTNVDPTDDAYDGAIAGYQQASTSDAKNMISNGDLDNYINTNLADKTVAYRDAFKNAYLDGLKVAKSGADAANANQSDATNGQNGAAQKAQSQGYKDAHNAFLDKLHGVDDKDATSNTPASIAGRQRASQYLLALQDVAEGHPNTGSTDPDYQKGLDAAQAAVTQAVADAKANKQLPADLSQIPVPEGIDPDAYRDAYAGILSGFYNGYNSKSTDSGSTDAYYNIAFGIGYAKGKASIPTDTSAPSDFLNNRTMPTITDPAVAKAYKQQYDEAKSGFYDALYNRGSKSNNDYYKASYKLAQDGLSGMRLAAKGNTKANRAIIKTKDASFINGYNGYLNGVAAAKRTLKKNKKLSAKDLLNKDKLYSYTFKEGLKHEIKIQRKHGKKFGTRRALERFAIPKNIYTHHSESYARTYVATYKKEMKRHMPRYIYNVGTIFTHNHVKFTRHTRIREYAYSARYNSTVFRVVGVKYYKNRIPRYRLSNGAVVTASQSVQNAYYKKHFKKYRVIKPTGVLIHTGKTFTKRNSVRRLYRGEVFHVRRVVKFHGITRLYVGKSAYITSNKTFVKAIIK
ncbi:DUF5776 domain-containing protein [Apilactobacillus kunkeei]|uniref:DUF5776 domain-containing protein n=1 Tax=Apilactobacillus kunkeei TaxID=148814 RepID=UPI004033431F